MLNVLWQKLCDFADDLGLGLTVVALLIILSGLVGIISLVMAWYDA